MMPRIRWLAALCLAGVAGCSSAPESCLVRGTVELQGKPVGGVYVALMDSEHQTVGAGRTDPGGAFQLTVARPGTYAVTCFLPKVTRTAEDYIEGDDILNGRYRDPRKPAAIASIMAGETVLPVIHLK